MKFYVLALWAVLGVAASDDDADPDAKAFMMSISMGRGLYHNFPHVWNINSTNFNGLVKKQEDVSWLIEFYNSWCGHCLRYTPTYKRFAADVKGWSEVVKVGAVDCANELNTPLCREYEILSYPTLRYFPPKFEEGFYGTDILKRKVEDLRESLVTLLSNRTDLFLSPFTGSSSALWDQAGNVRYIALFVDCKSETPSLGSEIVLDFVSVKEVYLAVTRCSNSALLQELDVQPNQDGASVYILHKGDSPKNLASGSITRPDVLEALHSYFESVGIQTPTPFNISSIKEVNVNLRDAYAWAQQYSDMVKKITANKHVDQVFQVDIEGAVRTTFTVEIPRKKHINGSLFHALKNYVDVINKYFPIGENGKNFLECVKHGVDSKTADVGMTGNEFSDIVGLCSQRFHPVWLDPDNGWLGCRGSLPTYRGFPCSMWTMFHTLTVQSWVKGASDPQEVLKAMVGYIGNFFGCSDCAGHFLRVSQTMAGNVTTLEDSVLWLWKAHNMANKRLQGDATEDPNFPKMQFPPPSVCPNCYSQRGLHNEKEVLSFLRNMYTDISYIVLSDIKTTPTTTVGYVSPRHEPKRGNQEAPVQVSKSTGETDSSGSGRRRYARSAGEPRRLQTPLGLQPLRRQPVPHSLRRVDGHNYFSMY